MAMTGMTHVNTGFLAGFALAAYELPDGTLKSTGGAKMNGWPEEITIEGITFTFEYAEFVGREDDPEGRFMNAQYV
jgi:hypothetical protein